VCCDAGHGARLSAVDSSTVSLSFHGSRHAEVTVQAASASSCGLLEQCVQNALAAMGMTVQSNWSGINELDALSTSIAALCVEVDACIGQFDRELCEENGTMKQEGEGLTLTDVRECMNRTDVCCSSVCRL
jgi:hypothetical protein